MSYFFLVTLIPLLITAKGYGDDKPSSPTDILPPEAIEQSSNSQSNFEKRISVLEQKIERLEKIVGAFFESLEEESDLDEPVEEMNSNNHLKDPVLEFEKIKQLAIAKSPTLEEKIEAFKTTYKDHPLVAKAHFFLADYYYSQKEYEKAIPLIKEGLVSYKGSPETGKGIWILALILVEMGKNNEACVSLKKILSLSEEEASSDLKQNATEKLRVLSCK